MARTGWTKPSAKSRVGKVIRMIQNDEVSLNRFQVQFEEWLADPKNMKAWQEKIGIKKLKKT